MKVQAKIKVESPPPGQGPCFHPRRLGRYYNSSVVVFPSGTAGAEKIVSAVGGTPRLLRNRAVGLRGAGW